MGGRHSRACALAYGVLKKAPRRADATRHYQFHNLVLFDHSNDLLITKSAFHSPSFA